MLILHNRGHKGATASVICNLLLLLEKFTKILTQAEGFDSGRGV